MTLKNICRYFLFTLLALPVASAIAGSVGVTDEPIPIVLTQLDSHAMDRSGPYCNLPGGIHGEVSYWRRFHIADHPEISDWSMMRIMGVGVGIWRAPPAWPVAGKMIAYVTSANSDPDIIDARSLVKIAESDYTITSDDNWSLKVLPYAAALSVAGNDLVIRWQVFRNDEGWFESGSSPSAQSRPTFISSEDCNVPEPLNAADLLASDNQPLDWFHVPIYLLVESGDGSIRDRIFGHGFELGFPVQVLK